MGRSGERRKRRRLVGDSVKKRRKWRRRRKWKRSVWLNEVEEKKKE